MLLQSQTQEQTKRSAKQNINGKNNTQILYQNKSRKERISIDEAKAIEIF